ncbi:hypothetical protein [Spirosoma foliorum]|uniref:Uncharacterized protein n=1 Tax=Spirosoma foliorum TaxID=2710596 RepID=A0A7G5H6Q3_9BACT|nr:hypothetical protein [Spirosoma foliorum]QMW06795.1 hypothetical protein H3H32_18820 [Spirosoma foliorum]
MALKLYRRFYEQSIGILYQSDIWRLLFRYYQCLNRASRLFPKASLSVASTGICQYFNMHVVMLTGTATRIESSIRVIHTKVLK